MGNYSNSTAIGYNATATGSNQVVLGTSSETVLLSALNIGSSQTIKAIKTGSVSPSSNANYSLSFGYTFSSTPIVMLSLVYRSSSACVNALAGSITTTGCNITVFNTSGGHVEASWTINWIAIG